MNITTSHNSTQNARFGFWGNLSLSRKMLLAFGALFVLGLVIAASGLIGLNRVQGGFEDTLAGGVEIQNRSDHLNNELLEARRREKDFLLRWQIEGFDVAYENYVKVNQQHTAEMKVALKDLSALAPALDRNPIKDYSKTQYEADIATLNQDVLVYEKSFASAVNLLQERGYVDTGLEGEFRVAVQDIETRIYNREGLDKLVITMLQIRRREKDYLLRGDQQFIDNVHDLIAQLKTEVSASDSELLTSTEKTEIRALADEYLAKFDALVAKDVEAANEIEVFRAAAAEIQTTTARLEAAGEQSAAQDVQTAQTNSTQTFTFTGIIVLLVLIVSIAVAVTLSQQLTRPILSLTNTAQEISAGKFDIQAQVNSGDEVGTLAKTFNIMTARLGQAFEDVNRRASELATVAEVSTATSTILNVNQLLQEVVDLTKERFNLYHSHIYLLDETGENLVLASGAGEAGRQMVAEKRSIPLDREQSLVARAAREQQGVIVNDVTQAPDFLPNPLLPFTRSELAVPMIVGNNVLGVFDVQSDQVGRFTNSDIKIQNTLAAQIATSLQNVRQFESTQKIAADLAVVASVGIATSTITNTGQLLQEAVDLTKKSFNFYHAHIYLLNNAEDTLELTAGAGEVGKQMVAQKRQIPLDSKQSLVARAAREAKGVTINDVTQAPDFLPNPLLPETRSEMALPMVTGGKVIGVLDVQSELVNRFTETDINIQTTLASQVAAALQNTLSFAQSQFQARRETELNLITQKIQSATRIDAALQIAARELGHALGMKQTIVSLEPEELAGSRKGNSND